MSRKPRPQPYRIQWPLNASQVESIDQMFQMLFDDIRNGNIGLETSVSGILPVVNGGTGLALYTVGDLIYAVTATSLGRLQIGAANKFLKSDGTVPTWSFVDLTTSVTGVLPIANGGTNSSTALSGSSIMISDGSKVVQGQKGTTTTVLHGNAAGAPTYGAVVEADMSRPVTVVTTNHTAATTERILKVTATGVTLTLPTAVGFDGHEFTIDNASVGDLIVNTTSSQTIQGLTSQTVPTDSSMTVYSDGANWRII